MAIVAASFRLPAAAVLSRDGQFLDKLAVCKNASQILKDQFQTQDVREISKALQLWKEKESFLFSKVDMPIDKQLAAHTSKSPADFRILAQQKYPKAHALHFVNPAGEPRSNQSICLALYLCPTLGRTLVPFVLTVFGLTTIGLLVYGSRFMAVPRVTPGRVVVPPRPSSVVVPPRPPPPLDVPPPATDNAGGFGWKIARRLSIAAVAGTCQTILGVYFRRLTRNPGGMRAGGRPPVSTLPVFHSMGQAIDRLSNLRAERDMVTQQYLAGEIPWSPWSDDDFTLSPIVTGILYR